MATHCRMHIKVQVELFFPFQIVALKVDTVIIQLKIKLDVT